MPNMKPLELPEDMDPLDVSVPYIVINEKTHIGKDGLKFVIKDAPSKHCLDNMMVVFDGEELMSTVEIEGVGKEVHPLTSTNLVYMAFEDEGTITCTLTSTEETVLHCFILYFIDMSAKPLALLDEHIVNHPEYSMNIGVNLQNAFDIFAGWDEVEEIHAQLKHADGQVDNIRGSTPNYIWRGKSLHMRVPIVASSYYFRIRYKVVDDEEWMEWSNWLTLNPKRKMTL